MKDDGRLLLSDVVANSTMNRDRACAGVNSYQRELGFDPVEFVADRLAAKTSVSWLDLCCGTGRALADASRRLCAAGVRDRVTLVGIDLIDGFRSEENDPSPPELLARSLTDFDPRNRTFDLITCVHGLHYIGDKLGAIARAVSWLEPEGGVFIAHLDPNHVVADGAALDCVRLLRANGLAFDRKTRRVRADGRKIVSFPWRFVGADDRVGANYTGQPAVLSIYETVAKSAG